MLTATCVAESATPLTVSMIVNPGAAAEQSTVAATPRSVPVAAVVGITLSALALVLCWLVFLRRRWRRSRAVADSAPKWTEQMPWTRSMVAVAALPDVASSPRSIGSATRLIRPGRPDLSQNDGSSVSDGTEVRAEPAVAADHRQWHRRLSLEAPTSAVSERRTLTTIVPTRPPTAASHAYPESVADPALMPFDLAFRDASVRSPSMRSNGHSSRPLSFAASSVKVHS